MKNPCQTKRSLSQEYKLPANIQELQILYYVRHEIQAEFSWNYRTYLENNFRKRSDN
jgi:hypothetical protein